jgi:hypothetical protein
VYIAIVRVRRLKSSTIKVSSVCPVCKSVDGREELYSHFLQWALSHIRQQELVGQLSLSLFMVGYPLAVLTSTRSPIITVCDVRV